MNTVFATSSSGNVGRQSGNEMGSAWKEAGSASPRDHLEFGAKVLGFTGQMCDCADLPHQDGAAPPVVTSPIEPTFSARAVSLEVIHVDRRAKASLPSVRPRVALPPRESHAWQQLVTRRIGIVSAALALAVTGTWLVFIGHEQADWKLGFASMALILPALFGLFFFAIDAAYGMACGATGRAREYMDQVFPPPKARTW